MKRLPIIVLAITVVALALVGAGTRAGATPAETQTCTTESTTVIDPESGSFVGTITDTACATSLPTMNFGFLRSESGSLDFTAPADFFRPGSLPVDEDIQVEGDPFGILGPFEFGTADTALMVLDAEDLPAVGAWAEFPLLAAAVSWRSIEPILVNTPSGPEAWHVNITLSEEASQPHGLLRLSRASQDGGTAHVSLPVVLRYTFIGPDGATRILDSGLQDTAAGVLVFDGHHVPWNVECPVAVLHVPRLSGGPCVGVDTAGQAVSWDLDAVTARITVSPALPVPGTPAQVHPSATVAADAHLGSGAIVLENASVGARAVIGPGALIGAGAIVDDDAIVGAGSTVGQGAVVEEAAAVGPGVVIGAGARLGTTVVLEDDVSVGQNASVGVGTTVGSDSQIGAGAQLGPSVKAGTGVSIGSSASVAPGLFLANGAVVPDAASVDEDYVTCVQPDGASFVATVGGCVAGSVLECVPPLLEDLRPPPPEKKKVVPGTLPVQDRDRLGNDVGSDIAPPSNGGTGQPYATTHDCDDFASELEVKLQGLGWNATFTCYWDVNPDWRWWNRLWTDYWRPGGHCLTDVRLADGSIVWIEAQFPGAQGVGVDLDLNGDGRVGIATSSGSSPTEDLRRIEVYDSRAAAEQAGVRLD